MTKNSNVIEFLKQNRIGGIIGGVFCGISFLVFFFTLSYGASCPESGPDVCTLNLEPIRPIIMINTLFVMSIWGIIFFSGQQIMQILGIVTPQNYSESFFAVNIMPGISIALTLFVWAIIGGLVQKFIIRIKR